MTLKRTARFGLFLAMLMLVPTPKGSAERRRSRHGCRAIRVSAPETPRKRHRRRKPKFSAAEIVDLELQVRFPRELTGQHEVELKLYTPKGNLYQSMSIPFSMDEEEPRESQERRRDQERRRLKSVRATFPVAGTSIVTNSLYGKWKVEAFLDGADQHCTSPRKFVIKP